MAAATNRSVPKVMPMSETDRSTGTSRLAAFLALTTGLMGTAESEICASIGPLFVAQGPAAASTVTALSASDASYDGAPFTLNELAVFYQYPRQGNRPLMTFGGPVPPARRLVKTNVPKRQVQTGLRVAPRSPAGPGVIRVPQAVSICGTDDAVIAGGPTQDANNEKDRNAYLRAYREAGRSNPPQRLRIRPETTESRTSGLPAVSRWPDIVDCSAADEKRVLAAWQLAHDYVWVAKTMSQFIYYAYPKWRPLLWSHGYDGDLDDAGDGASGKIGDANWSPRAWFGGYDGDRLSHVQRVTSSLWERFRFEDMKFDCDVSPGVQGEAGAFDEDSWSGCQHQNPGSDGGSPSAYHFPQGKIALCDKFFRSGSGRNSDAWLAKQMIHEMTHWIKWDDGAFDWVTDAHTVWCKNEGAKVTHVCHGAGSKMYGSENAVHLASRHAGYAFQNTDNYAYFIYRVGRSVKEKHLKYFPSSWEGFPEPPWSPPSGADNVCTAMQDNVPGNDPGVDICEGLKGASFDQCKGSVTGRLPPLCR